jgi:hypothetical protein
MSKSIKNSGKKFPDSGNFDVTITKTKHFDNKIYQIRQNSGKKKADNFSFWSVTRILAEFGKIYKGGHWD